LLLDKLTAIQAISDASAPRAAQSYVNGSGNEIKVEIPETGVSIGELTRYLHSWLGHETHIAGDIFHDGGDVTVIARTDGVGQTVRGSNTNLDGLLQQLGESVYLRTQPYRFSSYLMATGRPQQAVALLEKIAREGSPADRPWAILNLGYVALLGGHFEEGVALDEQAAALDPRIPLAYDNIATAAGALGHDEYALKSMKHSIMLAEQGRNPQYNERAYAIQLEIQRGNLATSLGDYVSAADDFSRATKLPDFAGNGALARFYTIDALSRSHDLVAARAALAQINAASVFERLELARSRSLAKFEEANRYAPHWGRLHLKWGEALGYVGRNDEARTQFQIASTQDLSVADKAELVMRKAAVHA
jgi:tetratricopeptide (TPR) repeat protein